MAVVTIMQSVAAKVLSTVNAPYGTALSAAQLAQKIADPASVDTFDASAFAFYSEVDKQLQESFLVEMKIDPATAATMARKFSKLAGYKLALAA
jgi:glycerate kinase